MHARFRFFWACVSLAFVAARAADDWVADPTYTPSLEWTGGGGYSQPRVMAAPGGKLFVTHDYTLNGRRTFQVPRRLNAEGSLELTLDPPTDASLQLLAV